MIRNCDARLLLAVCIVSFQRIRVLKKSNRRNAFTLICCIFRFNISIIFVCSVINLSDMSGTSSMEMKEYHTKKKLASSFNRFKFLTECIFEQVLPKSAPQYLKSKSHPFGTSARCYLEEACNDLKDNIYVLRDELNGVPLPSTLRTKLNELNDRQQARLKDKLKTLCDNSPWREAGSVSIITNLSSRELNRNEKEALALGLKFDSGRDKSTYVDHVQRNYKWTEDDIEKGFIQGILLCCKAMADQEADKLPRRYMKALKSLADDQSIVITQADKGGGVVIIDRTEYVDKMNELLNDQEVYSKKSSGFIEKTSKKFNQDARKVMKKTERGKQLLHLLEEAPTAPRMRGIPKLHKRNIPMRPITSGIGSAPHRLAKLLAKPLSKNLGAISDAHLRNSSDLIDRLQDINFSDKCLASFDVKALFTNVPVDNALKVLKEVVNRMDPNQLPLAKSDYLNLLSMCMKFGGFIFNTEEYIQHSGLAMGSPLSPVAACLYMEWLEKHRFQDIMGPNVLWMRYVDDVLLVVPQTMDLNEKLNELNSVDPKIQFTMEKENQGTIPFLDTEIVRCGNQVKFKVYRKPTNREDYVHFYSGHSDRVKRGVVLGFFLRALRICSDDYVDDEVQHVITSFMKLKYPKGLLLNLKRKAIKIRNKNKTKNANKDVRYISIPNSKAAETVAKELETTGVKVALTSGKKLGDMLSKKRVPDHRGMSVVYKVPCGACDKCYVGETGRGLGKRLTKTKGTCETTTTTAHLYHMLTLPTTCQIGMGHRFWRQIRIRRIERRPKQHILQRTIRLN